MAKGPRQEEAPKGSPMWMTTYSDLVSLLMCFFIMLFAMSSVDAEKFNEFAASMSRSESILDFGADSIMDLMGAGILELPEIEINTGEQGEDPGDNTPDDHGTPNDGPGTATPAPKPEYQAMQERFEQMADQLQSYFEDSNLSDNIGLEVAEQSVIMSFADAMMFDSGQAVLKRAAQDALTVAAELLVEFPESGIRIEGHTDDRPIHTLAYPTNYHLSFARAYSVQEFFEAQGIDVRRMQSIGYGEIYPIDTNDTPEGRANNRRVEIIIMSQYYTTTGQPRE